LAELNVTVTCPHCGYRAVEVMPLDRCVFVYECRGCQALIKPKPNECCVYCSYGDVRCPFVQDGTECPPPAAPG
jgi:hypothetical protein